jgi:hypothetical protein
MFTAKFRLLLYSLGSLISLFTLIIVVFDLEPGFDLYWPYIFLSLFFNLAFVLHSINQIRDGDDDD